MYVIIVYDIEVDRINKVRAVLRRYLFWVQNSVFEGEISESSYLAMMKEVNSIIDKEYDSIIVYKFQSQNAAKREVFGVDPGKRDFVI